jgi:regulator of protease activity HflC (stomatin/prohibitin superfamily)
MKRSIITVMLAMFVVGMLFTGCSTGVVPPGTVVMKATTGGEIEITTSGKYTAVGRDRIYFLDTKLKAFTENMHILCKDKVNMDVDVKWLGSFVADTPEQQKTIITKVPSVKTEVDGKEVYVLSLADFYKTAMSDIVRSNARMVVSPYVTDNIPEERQAIEKEISKRVIARLNKLGFPVKTTDILVSNLDFDDAVTDQRKAIKKAELDDQRKAALAKADVAQAKRDADIEREKGKAAIEKAKAKATANKILDASITPNILALKQWEVLEEAARGPNNQIWVMPYEALKTGVITNVALKSRSGK